MPSAGMSSTRIDHPSEDAVSDPPSASLPSSSRHSLFALFPSSVPSAASVLKDEAGDCLGATVGGGGEGGEMGCDGSTLSLPLSPVPPLPGCLPPASLEHVMSSGLRLPPLRQMLTPLRPFAMEFPQLRLHLRSCRTPFPPWSLTPPPLNPEPEREADILYHCSRGRRLLALVCVSLFYVVVVSTTAANEMCSTLHLSPRAFAPARSPPHAEESRIGQRQRVR